EVVSGIVDVEADAGIFQEGVGQVVENGRSLCAQSLAHAVFAGNRHVGAATAVRRLELPRGQQEVDLVQGLVLVLVDLFQPCGNAAFIGKRTYFRQRDLVGDNGLHQRAPQVQVDVYPLGAVQLVIAGT